jgi:hypothetical protein
MIFLKSAKNFKVACLKLIVPRKCRLLLGRGISAMCVKVLTLNRPKKTGNSIPRSHCGVTSRVKFTVTIGPIFL